MVLSHRIVSAIRTDRHCKKKKSRKPTPIDKTMMKTIYATRLSHIDITGEVHRKPFVNGEDDSMRRGTS